MIMRLAKRLAVLFFIFLISCQGAEDDGMVHFGTFHSNKYYRVTVKYLKEPTFNSVSSPKKLLAQKERQTYIYPFPAK